MAMLKELVAGNEVNPDYVNIVRRDDNSHYQTQIKCDYNNEEIEEYAKKQLTITEDKNENILLFIGRKYRRQRTDNRLTNIDRELAVMSPKGYTNFNFFIKSGNTRPSQLRRNRVQSNRKQGFLNSHHNIYF